MENPDSGIVEADHIDHERVLEVARPYLGEMAGVYGDWTPLLDRASLFAEEIDRDDPWQFRNFLVV
jgi:homospermidine synthase